MFSRLIFVAVGILACWGMIAEAGEADEVPQCAKQVSGKLQHIVMPKNVEAHAADVIKFMDKLLDADGNVVEGSASEEAAEVDTENRPELDRDSCVEHLEKFYFATSNSGCHRKHWRFDWKEYDRALFATNEQTHRAVIGARRCINFLDAYMNDPETSEMDKKLIDKVLVRVM